MGVVYRLNFTSFPSPSPVARGTRHRRGKAGFVHPFRRIRGHTEAVHRPAPPLEGIQHASLRVVEDPTPFETQPRRYNWRKGAKERKKGNEKRKHLWNVDAKHMVRHVQLYYTGMASTAKSKTDTRRIMTLLDAKRIPYEAIDLCMEPTRKADIAGLPDKHLPVVLVQGESIGGFDDIQELEDDGQLERVVQRNKVETSSKVACEAEETVLKEKGNMRREEQTLERTDRAEKRKKTTQGGSGSGHDRRLELEPAIHVDAEKIQTTDADGV